MVTTTHNSLDDALHASDSTGRREALQGRLDRQLGSTRERYGPTLDKIGEQAGLIKDSIVPLGKAGRMHFSARDGNLLTQIDGNDDRFSLSPWAATQAGTKLGVPGAYIKELAYGAPWQRDLCATVLNEHADHSPRERVLVRTIGDEIKGILSDRYRRLNSAQIVEGFIRAGSDQGLSLYRAELDETQLAIELILPSVYQVPAGLHGVEFSTWGARLSNSDVGDGALSLSIFTMRAACTNLCVFTHSMRTVHLGGRLSSDIQYSDRTYRHDTLTQAGMVSDTVNHMFQPKAIEERIEAVSAASKDEVDAGDAIKALPRIGLTKAEAESVGNALQNNREDQVPAGPVTRYKLSQAIANIAQGSDNDRRRRDLEELAGKYMTK